MRLARRMGALLLAGVILLALGGAAVAGASGRRGEAAAAHVPGGNWTQFDYDAEHSGVGPADTGISARNVGSLRLRIVPLDGTVDSAPVELHSVKLGRRRRDLVIVTTTYGRAIALDPRSGARLWEYTPGDLGSYAGTYQVTTASPAIDPGHRYVYSASPDGLIHKLAVDTGHEVRSAHWPARMTFDATREKLASSLTISGGSVVVVTGGYYGDAPPYQGHVVMIDRRSGRINHVFNTLCSNRSFLIRPPGSCPASDAAIWSRAGAVIEPRSHRVLVATGNGPFNGSTEWGDSVLELGAAGGRLLHNWTPAIQAALSNSDTDLGSSSPALLPSHLAVQGGKDGVLHLLDLGRLNGTSGAAGGRLGGELQDISSPGGVELYTQPTVWGHRGQTYVFVATNSGTAAYALRGRRLHGSLVASLPAAGGHWNTPIVVGGRAILPVGNYMHHATTGTLLIYHLPGR